MVLKNADDLVVKLLTTVCIIIQVLASDKELSTFVYKNGDAITADLCPCDMTGGACDVYCCCDKDCPEEPYSSFACDVSMHSGDSRIQLPDWKCGADKSGYSVQFSSILCIQKANGPYLGHYYPPPNDITDLPSLNLLLSKQNNFWKNVETSYFPHEKMWLTRTSSKYVFGQNLVLQLPNQEVTFLFPYNVYNGKCELSYPLSFLKDITSLCTTRIGSTQDILLNSLFNISTFLVGDLSERNLLSFPSNKTAFTNISVMFQHAVNPCCYLSSIHCKLPFSCTNSVTELHNGIPGGPMCSNGTCRNTVLEVDYRFFWKNSKIMWLNITVTLGDIPFINDQGDNGKAISVFLTQHFSAVYVYLQYSNTSEMILDGGSLMRSGKYGYEIGLPLIGAILVHNESDFEQNSSAVNKMYLYMPTQDVSGECTLKKVNFGQDLFSGCFFRMKLSNFSNCVEIKSHILEIQSQVLQVSILAKFGDPDFQNMNDFVEVLEEEFPQNASSDHDVIEELPWQPEISSCNNVPHHVQFQVLYTDADNIRGLPVYRVIGAIRRYDTQTWDIPCDPTSSCHGNQSVTFPLSAAVRYSFISSEKNRKVKRFWASSAPVTLCKEETCWQGILYPLMPSFTLNDVIGVANNCLFILLFVLPFAWLKIRRS